MRRLERFIWKNKLQVLASVVAVAVIAVGLLYGTKLGVSDRAAAPPGRDNLLPNGPTESPPNNPRNSAQPNAKRTRDPSRRNGRSTRGSDGGTNQGGTSQPPGQALGSGRVGYLGCSQTTGAVEGYHNDGGDRLWPTIEYGGGSISRWATVSDDDARYWGAFRANLKSRPSSVIWWQLCVQGGGVQTNYDNALTVLHRLRGFIASGTKIYVSAQNDYVPPHVCSISGPDGPETAQKVADKLVGEPDVYAGPKMTALRGPDSAGSGPTQTKDSCHPNDAGEKVLGEDLLEFFG